MAEKFNPGSFAPFLEGVKRASSNPTPTPPAPIGILRILAGEPSGKMTLSTLVSRTGLNLDALAGMVQELEKAGLTTPVLEGTEQAIALTQTGQGVAQVQF